MLSRTAARDMSCFVIGCCALLLILVHGIYHRGACLVYFLLPDVFYPGTACHMTAVQAPVHEQAIIEINFLI